MSDVKFGSAIGWHYKVTCRLCGFESKEENICSEHNNCLGCGEHNHESKCVRGKCY